MKKYDAQVTLRQILRFAHLAQTLCSQTTYERLISDWRDQAALERLLECVGEAVKRLPSELRDSYPAVPWRKVTGTRDYLCHGYDSLDYKLLWELAVNHLPLLMKTVEEMLKAFPAEAKGDDAERL